MFAWRALPARPGAAPGAYLTVPALRSAGIRVAFTTRAGGRSVPPYASLNLSYVSGDDPDTVRDNRARSLETIGAGLDSWVSGRQVHGNRVEHVGAVERGRGALDPDDTLAETDALWTEEPGGTLAVLTADCVPLLLADPDRRRIAAVHAGWRGLTSGVIEAAVKAMGGATLAAIGPAIGPCCYEVGDDVAIRAAEALGDDVVRREGARAKGDPAPSGNRDPAPGPKGDPAPGLRGRGATVTHVDLWRGARLALRRAGVRVVIDSSLCTRCEPHRFFSHRAGDTGRQGLLVTIAER